MPGFSLTLLLLPRSGSSAFSAEKVIQYLDAPTDAPGWPWHAHQEPKDEAESLVVEGRSEDDGRKGLPVIKRMSFILIAVTAVNFLFCFCGPLTIYSAFYLCSDGSRGVHCRH